jgi:hypothetical protein
MIIHTEISFPEYRNLLFKLTYKKPGMMLILGVATIMLLWILGYYSHLLPVPEPKIYQYLTLGFITLVQPSVIFWTIKQVFDSSTHLGQQLKIELTEDIIKIHGEFIYMEIRWDNIFKVDELNTCFLIYQNSLSAIIIPKKDFPEEDHQELRDIFGTLSKLPVHLKQ